MGSGADWDGNDPGVSYIMKTLDHVAIENGEGSAESRRVVAVLPRGEAIRNFVFGGALDLMSREADVHVLSVMPDEEIREMMTARYASVAELRQIPERWPVRIQREILDMAHGRWLWSEAARDRWKLRDIEAQASAFEKSKRAIKKAGCLPFANRPGLTLLSKMERATSRLLRTTDEYFNYFRELRPSLVFNGSHVHCVPATQPVQAAQWLGIPTATFIFSWDNLTSQGRIMLPYDYYLCWSDEMRDQLLDLYPSIPPDKAVVTGTPQFDFHFQPEYHWSREQFCAIVGADPNRPIVLYSTGMPNYMPQEMRVVEGIADILKTMTSFGPPQLLCRVYPKDRTNRFDDLRMRRPDILFPPVNWDQVWLTPKPDDVALYTNTLLHVEAGINISSTVTLELCMFDKPVLNVAYDPPGCDISPVCFANYYKFDHYRPVAESGAVAVVRSQDKMRDELTSALTEPEKRRDARRALIRKMFGNTLDGNAGKRVAERLLDAAGIRSRRVSA